MKYLTHYIEDANSAAFRKHGAFFCFDDKDFKERKEEGKVYVNLRHGLLCPKESAAELMMDLSKNYKEGVKKDLEENGKEAIIRRELSNHEAYYSWDYDKVAEGLKDYGITLDEVKRIFFIELPKQEL